jgi:tRNA pseudouridine38-40 synthase
MRNIKLTIEYDGTSDAGWQQQKDEITVQETLKAAIENVVGEKIVLYGAGRTDAGVHAQCQVANFKTTSQISSSRLPFAINSHLPKDIVVNAAQDADDKFHARFSAKWKIYQYTIYNSHIRPALNRDFCCYYNFPLNHRIMRKGAELLRGTHDFSAFKTGPLPDDNNVRKLKRLEIKRKGEYIFFMLEADGFLRHMARRIAGALLELGRGKISIEDLRSILESKDPQLGGPTAPAKGLCLLEVKY